MQKSATKKYTKSQNSVNFLPESVNFFLNSVNFLAFFIIFIKKIAKFCEFCGKFCDFFDKKHKEFTNFCHFLGKKCEKFTKFREFSSKKYEFYAKFREFFVEFYAKILTICKFSFTFYKEKLLFNKKNPALQKFILFLKTPQKFTKFREFFIKKCEFFSEFHGIFTKNSQKIHGFLKIYLKNAKNLQKFTLSLKTAQKFTLLLKTTPNFAHKIPLIALFCILFCACATKERPNHAVLDLPQSVKILPKPHENTLKIDENDYKKRFFAAWHFEPKMSQKERQSLENWVFQTHKIYANPKNNFYFFNKQKIPLAFLKNALNNANTADFLSVNRYAITISNTPIKNIPTHTAILRNPFLQNEGVPFDYALDSVLNIGAAVFVSHFSLDKRYAFVLYESGWGFVDATSLEFISKNEIEKYENSRFFTPLKEKLALYDEDGNFAFEARIGGIYPFQSLENGTFKGCIGKKCYKIDTFGTQNSVNFLVDSANLNQNLEISSKTKNENFTQNFTQNSLKNSQNFHSNEKEISSLNEAKNSQNSVNFSQNVAEFPLKWDEKNIKTLIYQLLGRPYGWGGYDFERDCSALVRDFFAAFGAWLPRNSHAQAHFWQNVDVSGLDNATKKRLIMRYAKPYETLLHFKGHIMLYVGIAKPEIIGINDNKNVIKPKTKPFKNNKNIANAEPIALHAIWGLRASDGGRLLIAKTALTTLEIGKKNDDIIQETLLLNRLERLTFLNPQTADKIQALIKNPQN